MNTSYLFFKDSFNYIFWKMSEICIFCEKGGYSLELFFAILPKNRIYLIIFFLLSLVLLLQLINCHFARKRDTFQMNETSENMQWF